MQRILITSLKALLQSIIIVYLMLLFSLLALFFSFQQPGFAATPDLVIYSGKTSVSIHNYSNSSIVAGK